MLTHERLRELLHYDPDTGVFTWRVFRRGKAREGSKAGRINSNGYNEISVDGRRYKAHRLAWFYVIGNFPRGMIDHENAVRHDNRISNLRDGTRSFNGQNQKRSHNGSSSGMLGVSPSPRGGWIAKIGLDGHRIILGTYASKQAAYSIYLMAKRRLHPGCTI